jgi:hypothetical protein
MFIYICLVYGYISSQFTPASLYRLYRTPIIYTYMFIIYLYRSIYMSINTSVIKGVFTLNLDLYTH